MNRYLILSAFSAALLAAAPGFAQDATSNEGAYEALSPGNQKIASAIYDANLQAQANDSSVESLSQDDIAAMKGDGGWGKTYNELYAKGEVSYRNLGQAISAYNHSVKAASATSSTVVTTGNGQQIVGGGKQDSDTGSVSAKANGHGGGNGTGHGKPTVITSGTGGSVSVGPASQSSAGGMSGFASAGGAKGRGQGGANHKGK